MNIPYAVLGIIVVIALAVGETLDAVSNARNSAVQDYNTATEQFPGSIIAGMFNSEHREIFDVGGDREDLSTVTEVKF